MKNKGLLCYFLSSKGQKIKNVTKIEEKKLFFRFFVSFFFFLAFLMQKITTIKKNYDYKKKNYENKKIKKNYENQK